MTRDESIAKGKAAIDAAQGDALGGAFDDGVQAGGGSAGGPSEEEIKARIAQAVADAQAIDAQALADAHAEAEAHAADLSSQLEAMASKDASDVAIVKQFTDKLAELQGALDLFKSFLP